MARCRFRPVAYRIGLCFIALGFVMIALGYGFPTWIRTSHDRTRGLWMECDNPWASCLFVPPKDEFGWAVTGVLAASLLTYVATFGMAIRENCCLQSMYTCCLGGRKTEVLAFIAELLGIGGVLLYSVKEYEAAGSFSRLSWAHALSDFGLAVSLIGSIMMACAQQSLPAAKAAAGRIVAKPGYETLANNHRSASVQSRSTHCTQPSPFQGRSSSAAPHISGPFPSPAAIAAVNAAVSPKQQRAAAAAAAALNGPQPRKLSSPTPYPQLDGGNPAAASPSRRRKSSGGGQQFAGLHNPAKHPPVFSSDHVQEEWRAQQSHTWSESMREEEEEAGVRQQRALKSQMEQEQALKHHAHTWSAASAANERERSWGHTANTHHYDRDWRATTRTEHYVQPHHPKMPPPPAPPSTVAPACYGHPAREGYQDYPPPDPRMVQAGYQYPGYPEGQWAHHPLPPSHQLAPPRPPNPRPDSGNFPDPPPPEQLLCYEEERPTETVSYHGFPNPIPGDLLPPPPGHVQPVVLYRAPSHPGQGVVTETVAIQDHHPYHHAPNSCPTTPRPTPALPAHHHAHPHPHHQQPHQTFPRQQAGHPPVNPYAYATYGR